MAEQHVSSIHASEEQTHSSTSEEKSGQDTHMEQATDVDLVYDNDDEEPELHARTWLALLAMLFLNMVQVLALQGPPAAVCNPSMDLFQDEKNARLTIL